MFNIITTNKNKTATAPTYTITNVKARNSACKQINKKITLTKTKIINKTECIGLRAVITIRPDVKIKLENKKKSFNQKILLKCNDYLIFLLEFFLI